MTLLLFVLKKERDREVRKKEEPGKKEREATRSCRRACLGALVLGDEHQGGRRPRAVQGVVNTSSTRILKLRNGRRQELQSHGTGLLLWTEK